MPTRLRPSPAPWGPPLPNPTPEGPQPSRSGAPRPASPHGPGGARASRAGQSVVEGRAIVAGPRSAGAPPGAPIVAGPTAPVAAPITDLGPLAPLTGPLALAPGTAPDAISRAQLLGQYLSRYVSEHSARAMGASLRACARALLGRPDAEPVDVPWESLRYQHLQALRAQLVRDGYAWASVNRHMLAVRGILRECRRQRLIPQDDLQDALEVPMLRRSAQDSGRALSSREVRALFAACDAGPAGARNRALLALAVQGALRRSELAGLDLSHWRADGARMQVLGKGHKWRDIFLPPDAARHVAAWIAVRGNSPGPLLWPMGRHGQPREDRLSPDGIETILQSIAKDAGVARFSPHDLRRTAITRLLEKGADALTVAKLVGHESVQTTMKYDLRGDEAKKRAMAMLEEEESAPPAEARAAPPAPATRQPPRQKSAAELATELLADEEND